jgi:hypothetical protein
MAEAYICSLSKVQRHAEICKEINNLYERKNHDYGDSFHQTFVEEGMAMARIRLGDKFSRFKTLSRGGEQMVYVWSSVLLVRSPLKDRRRLLNG